jgi:hypothetical protein
MQDYNINVNYNISNETRETNIKKSKTDARKKKTVPKSQPKSNIRGLQKAIGSGLGVASKINNYVGALTENVIQQRNTQTALTYAGMGVVALSNPLTATLGATLYTGDKIAQYQIKIYKSNLSAGFLRQLSNGVYTTKR